MEIFKSVYRTSCIVCCIGIIVWNVYLYLLDEDLVKVEFQEVDVEVSLRLCFNSPYDSHNGNRLHVDDYVSNVVVERKNDNPAPPPSKKSGADRKPYKPYDKTEYTGRSRQIVLRHDQSIDCLDISIPWKKNAEIHALDVGVRKDVIKPNNGLLGNKISGIFTDLDIGMVFRGDLFILPNKGSNDVELINNLQRNFSGMTIRVKSIEAFRRRNKPSSPCVEFKSAFQSLKYGATEHGCIPSGWETSHGSSECKEEKYNTSEMNNFDEMSKLLIDFHHKPESKFCQTFRNIKVVHDYDKSINSCTDEEDSYRIRVIYDIFPYIETALVRAYTEFELLMNIGFIISLFYGVTILQIPNILTKTYNKLCGKKFVPNLYILRNL